MLLSLSKLVHQNRIQNQLVREISLLWKSHSRNFKKNSGSYNSEVGTIVILKIMGLQEEKTHKSPSQWIRKHLRYVVFV